MTMILSFLAALKAGDTFARVGAIMAIGLTLFGLAIWQAEKFRRDGAAAERTRIERANTGARNLADEAERDVLSCPAGRWDRETSRCRP